MVGIINLALRTGMSHFETRYGSEPIAFDAETSLTPVSLHPWIVIRETSQVKGWIRRIPTTKLETETSLDDSLDRIRFFLSEFDKASESGDVHDRLGRRQLSARERRLLQATNRALRWLNTASSEEDLLDKFTSTYIALETILTSIIYPGVFEGERATLRVEIMSQVRKIKLPNANQESLAITTEMLENRILQNNWPLQRKLNIFAESLGIQLDPSDKKLVGKLSSARNTILHEGGWQPRHISRASKPTAVLSRATNRRHFHRRIRRLRRWCSQIPYRNDRSRRRQRTYCHRWEGGCPVRLSRDQK